jgi:SagB-type dehydrogenase family enzyme
LNKETGKEFMIKTQYQFIEPSDQNKGLPQPPIELDYDKSLEMIDLPEVSKNSIPEYSLKEAIESRKSIRKYSNRTLSLEELSWLLWCTQGIKEILGDYRITLRNVPSAGARHAFETYLLMNKVESLQPGVYRFLATINKLIAINLENNIAEKLTNACLQQSHIKNSAVSFFWVAVPYRMCYRYGERGYRYLHIDVGHVCQNLYLAAGNIGCGVCAVAAFDDQKVNDLFTFDGEEKFVIYLATVGKLK